MTKDFLKKMCCPFDKKELNIQVIKEHGEEIIEGILTCSHCNRYFPIIYSIPIMTPDEYRDKALELPMLQKWGLAISEDQQSFALSTSPETLQIDKS
ncbi:Uncharacterized conserved protein YbaR, Trm112 family [Ekhidna lutea]|uniref:Uncharacterized conserved protein YbaR, Trm112 family n=1 Tax=Ekhidna lutea TaxID=447679 RepID=A0A239FJL7_EKHLU|nr:Trm112 family protein [Ekhidna lutea]SNS56957.1 Uncharacterized conserved protein YbaR, Trm112 family [Ekhidna lutea]